MLFFSSIHPSISSFSFLFLSFFISLFIFLTFYQLIHPFLSLFPFIYHLFTYPSLLLSNHSSLHHLSFSHLFFSSIHPPSIIYSFFPSMLPFPHCLSLFHHHPSIHPSFCSPIYLSFLTSFHPSIHPSFLSFLFYPSILSSSVIIPSLLPSFSLSFFLSIHYSSIYPPLILFTHPPIFLCFFLSFLIVPKDLEIEENTKVILLKFEFLDFQSMGKKIVYHICAKSVNFWQLRERIATKWRTYLSLPSDVNPSWRLLYKPPIPKKNVEIYSGEYFIACCLQTTLFLSSMKWLYLHVLFVRLLTLFHLFCECSRFTLLFVLLEKLIMKLDFHLQKPFLFLVASISSRGVNSVCY